MSETPARIVKTTEGLQRVTDLVRFFGFEPKRTLSFWETYRAELEWIYTDLHRAYLAMAKAAHPDNGGSHEASVSVNTAWTRLQRMFAFRCPSLGIALPRWEPRPRRSTATGVGTGRGLPPEERRRQCQQAGRISQSKRTAEQRLEFARMGVAAMRAKRMQENHD